MGDFSSCLLTLMSASSTPFTALHTVADFAQHYGFPPPNHPLVAVIDLAQHSPTEFIAPPALRHLYVVLLKRHFHGKLPYGQQEYDYQQGGLSFYAPSQPVQFCPAAASAAPQGWLVVFHPQLLTRNLTGPFPGGYPFFAYRVRQALALTTAEEDLLNQPIQWLRQEIEQPVDSFTQQLLSTQLDILLQYVNRLYHQQFPIEPIGGPDILSRFETLLATYLEDSAQQPLPTVQYFAEALHISPIYLSEVLRTHTGQNAQQYLHAVLLEKAKQLLLGTSLSIRQVAFHLGYDSPSYLGRLFKLKLGLTPAKFRQSVAYTAMHVSI